MAEPTYLKVGMIPRTAIFEPSEPRMLKGTRASARMGRSDPRRTSPES